MPATAVAGAVTARTEVAAGETAIVPLVPLLEPSEAVTVHEPAVFSVTGNEWTPTSAPVNAYEPGDGTCGSPLPRLTVPV